LRQFTYSIYHVLSMYARIKPQQLIDIIGRTKLSFVYV